MGLSHESCFAKYHHVLNRAEWLPLLGSKILLTMLVKTFGNALLVLFIDETLERRKGPKIKAKGYYRDAVRSSKTRVVKSPGLKWLTLSMGCFFPFSKRCYAVPFMTVLEPSEKSDKAAKKRHKTTLDWTVQMLKQVVRWLNKASTVLVGDGCFACAQLAWECLGQDVCLISRLKMNARLFDFPPEDSPGKRGRKRTKGGQLIGFKGMLEIPDLGWKEVTLNGYDKKKKRIRYVSSTCLWGVDGFLPVPIRWVLVVDPEGHLDPLPLMCTDVTFTPEKIVELYIQRWNLEVTFEEVREHLGVETQRQWSDKAIARTTPILMGLYTIVCLIANRLHEDQPIVVAQTAWYEKEDATFSDLLTAVRKVLWKDNLISKKHIFESFLENNRGLDELIDTDGGHLSPEKTWMGMLFEHLAAS
jgi:hypothetical protein